MLTEYEIQKLKRDMEANLGSAVMTVIVSMTGLLIVAVVVVLGFDLRNNDPDGSYAAAQGAWSSPATIRLFAAGASLARETGSREIAPRTLTEHTAYSAEPLPARHLPRVDEFTLVTRTSD